MTISTTETASPAGALSRWGTLGYGALAYVIALTSILYAMGFLSDLAVPKHINAASPGGTSVALAVAINLALLSVFAIQHSVMARPAFKAWWTRVTPAQLERPTYVLLSGAALWVLFWQWQPMTDVIWAAEAPALRAALNVVYWTGWVVMLLATFMVNHFDLFGLEQVWTHFRGGKMTQAPFLVRGFYKLVRHPIQLGLLIAFWATPDLTVGRLLFAGVTTGYILVALQLEERDLLKEFGERYVNYRRQVFMLLPLKVFKST